MRVLTLIGVVLLLLCFVRGSPLLKHTEDNSNGGVTNMDNDVTNSRRKDASNYHHHRPTFHDDLDTNLNYDVIDPAPEIIDLTGGDPCEGTICHSNELCVVNDRKLPLCVNKKDIASYSGINSHGHCVSCDPETRSEIPVCGSNGQTYKSECGLKYKACLYNVDLRLICDGECPCPLDLIAQSVESDMRIDDVTKILGSPQDLTVTSLEDDKTSARVEVSWTPPSGYKSLLGTNAVTDFVVHYSEEGDSEWKSIRTPGSVTSLSLTGLHSNALYYFRIQAQTSSAIGPLSDAIFHRTIHVFPEEEGSASGGESTTDDEYGDVTEDDYPPWGDWGHGLTY